VEPAIIHKECARYLAFLLLAALPQITGAQSPAGSYPNKPVRVVVPFAPGASTDLIARLLGQRLSEAWSQQFIVDNGGRRGSAGRGNGRRAEPDGYTLMVTNPGPSLNNILLAQKTTVHFQRLHANCLYRFCAAYRGGQYEVPAQRHEGANRVRDKRIPARQAGLLGTGSNPHAALEVLKAVTGVNIVHVPYKGTGPALTDVIAGQIHGLYTTTVSADAFIRNGRAKVLGVAGPKRQAVIPNVPTLVEQGIAGADNLLWIGLVTTAKVPRSIVDKLNREVNRVLRLPDVKQRFDQLGLDVEGGTPEHFGAFIRSQADAMSALIRNGALQPD